MNSEDGWRIQRSLGDAARPRPRSNGKGSLRERKNNEMRELIYVEKDNIAWHATNQALEWILEETETMLIW
jgi:hypothetical protein